MVTAIVECRFQLYAYFFILDYERVLSDHSILYNWSHKDKNEFIEFPEIWCKLLRTPFHFGRLYRAEGDMRDSRIEPTNASLLSFIYSFCSFAWKFIYLSNFFYLFIFYLFIYLFIYSWCFGDLSNRAFKPRGRDLNFGMILCKRKPTIGVSDQV